MRCSHLSDGLVRCRRLRRDGSRYCWQHAEQHEAPAPTAAGGVPTDVIAGVLADTLVDSSCRRVFAQELAEAFTGLFQGGFNTRNFMAMALRNEPKERIIDR